MKTLFASGGTAQSFLCSLSLAAILLNIAGFNASAAPAENTIYDPSPNHLWNRLNETLFERTAPDAKKYGLDELDILFWQRTTNLLAGNPHQQAVSVLDEFLNTHGEKLIHDPLKRALLQRDLWELFDWSAKPDFFRGQFPVARRELQSRLALAIRRVALVTNEIAALPDNYAQSKTDHAPALPRGLAQTNGDWVSVSDQNDLLTAPSHVGSFRGHSTFEVLVRFPGGRQAAIAYLDKLRRFEHVWIYVTNNSPSAPANEPRATLTLNPSLPQFPTDTEWALVRRMCVIDTDGIIRPTSVTESIQLRRYFTFAYQLITNSSGGVNRIIPQNCHEFQMNRLQNGQLRELGQNEKGFNFVHFMGMGFDPFEYTSRNAANEVEVLDSTRFQSATLHTCMECHNGAGIFSVNCYTRSLSFFSESPQRPANLTPLDFNREVENTIDWKHRQFDWGLLQGLWLQNN